MDFNLILSRVTIRDILADAGYHPGRSRVACPIHKGNNRTAFSFTESTFCCFVCDAKGGLIDLVKYLHGYNKDKAIKYLLRMAGLPEEVAQQSAGTFRRDSDPPDVSEDILQVRQALKEAKEWAKRTKPVSDELAEAKNRLEWLKLIQDGLYTCLRLIRRKIREGGMPLADALTKEHIYLYQLEELDTDISCATWGINRLKEKVN